ncbi:MAG: hypothetical protein ACREKL_02290 [Chthoniobacterales bacterium]
MKRGSVEIALFAMVVASSHAEITLTDIQNRKATVEIVAASATGITVEVQGRRSPIKLEQLSPDSRTAAIDYAKSKGVFSSFPAVSVQVKIAYQRRNNAATWYKKDVKLIPSMVIEGIRKMENIPAAEATLVVITHDTQEKYVNHNDKMQVYASETIEVPASAKGDRRELTFKTVEMTFDTARDTSNVGGNEYRYYIFSLRDPATRQLISFQTSSAKVQSYVAKHPEARDALLAAKQNSAFTEDFPQK